MKCNNNEILPTSQLVLVHVQVLGRDLSGPMSLRFGLGTFFGPDSVHW